MKFLTCALLALAVGAFALEIDTPLNEADSLATLKICGNYCGPGWCSATAIDETSCVKKGIWGKAPANDCTDACCRIHDKCCAQSDRSACNKQIVSCVSSCSGACAFAVRNAMKVVSNMCCGSFCPRSLIKQLDHHLNITDNTPDPLEQLFLSNPTLYAEYL